MMKQLMTTTSLTPVTHPFTDKPDPVGACVKAFHDAVMMIAAWKRYHADLATYGNAVVPGSYRQKGKSQVMGMDFARRGRDKSVVRRGTATKKANGEVDMIWIDEAGDLPATA